METPKSLKCKQGQILLTRQIAIVESMHVTLNGAAPLFYEVSQITSSQLPVGDAVATIAAAALSATGAIAVVIENRSGSHSRPVWIYTEENNWSISHRSEIPNQLPHPFRSLFISQLQ